MQDRQPPLDVFVGRAVELARVAEVIARIETGQPWLVAIEGNAGMGKTALARRCLAQAAGLTVLSARGEAAEADLDYGIIDQLLRAAGGVSQPACLWEGAGPAVSSFAVGARLLEVVGEQLATGSVAIFIDDLQWADRKSVEALTFMLRRLSVDPAITVVTYRGSGERLGEPAQRMLSGVENRLHIPLEGLRLDEVASLAAAFGTESPDDEVVRRLYQDTGGHPLYLRTLLSEGSGFGPRAPGTAALPRSLAAAIGDHVRGLPSETVIVLEMLAVLNLRMPLAQLGQAAQVGSPSAAIEPAVALGLVEWWPEEPTCPAAIRHALVRDAVYAGIPAARRRLLHARAASVVSEAASWKHRVAALDRPDEDLAAELERLAAGEVAAGHPALAATHLRWASDISPARADRERRLLTAALHLTLADESPGEALREAVEGAAPSPLRGCVLGTMAYSSGQLAEAERRFSQALAQAQEDPDNQPMAAQIANRLAGTYTLLGDGEKVLAFGRQALESGLLDAAVASQTRNLISMGASLVSGPRPAWPSWPTWMPTRRGCGDRRGRPVLPGTALAAGWRSGAGYQRPDRQPQAGAPGRDAHPWRARLFLAGAGPVPGRRVGRRAAHRRAGVLRRRYPLPPVRAAAAAPGRRVRAGRARRDRGGRTARPAGRGGRGQRGLRPGTGVRGMARALVCQAAGDYLGMADALGPWQDELGPGRPQPALRGPVAAAAGRGPGRLGPAGRRPPPSWPSCAPTAARSATSPGPGLAGRMAGRAARRPRRGAGDLRPRRGQPPARSPVHAARLLLAHGRLLRRTGQRRQAVERLRRASEFTAGCAPRRSSPGPRRNWPPATCPAPRPGNSRCWR